MPDVPDAPPGFPRPDPIPSPHLPAIGQSVIVKLNDGSIRCYPGLADYVSYYVSQGAVTDLNDLIRNYSQQIGEIFIQWIRTGQLGCIFALNLAKKPRESRWLPIVRLNALLEGNRLGESLNALLDVASESQEAAVVIFLDDGRLKDIVDLGECFSEATHLCR